MNTTVTVSVSVTVEMTPAQVAAWAWEYGIDSTEVVDDVRSYLSAATEGIQDTYGAQFWSNIELR